MIQSIRSLTESAIIFSQFKNMVEELSPQIQKIYSTPHFIVLTLRFRGFSKNLYIGRGGSYQGLYWFSKLPDSKYRIQKDRLLELFRKYFRGLRLNSIEVSECDRFFTLKCGNKKSYSYLYWFIKGGQAFASIEFQSIDGKRFFYHLWDRKIQKRELIAQDFLEEFYPLGLKHKEGKSEKIKDLNFSPDRFKKEEEDYWSFLEEAPVNKRLTKKGQRKIQRKVENIKGDVLKLEKGLNIEKYLNREAFEIPAGSKVKIEGLNFYFGPDETFYQKRDKMFQKLKRIKWALKLQYERLDKIENIRTLPEEDFELPKAMQPIWFHRLGHSESRDESRVSSEENNDLSIYKLENKTVLGVGKNTRGNDYLRNKWGKKNDLWFHLEGRTGAHAVLKGEGEPQLYAIIGSILRDHSKVEINEIPLVFSPLNKVKGLKGRAGAVTIKNPKYLQVNYNPKWREIISPFS